MKNKQSQPIHICIGPPRSGTTWLFNNLKDSKDIFVPCVKEVRYLSEPPSLEQKKAIIEHFYNTSLPENQKKWLDKWSKINDYSLGEYYDLMQNGDIPTIDISPQYSIMSLEKIIELEKTIPKNSKVIFFARNPLDRALSELKLHTYMHGRFRGKVDDGALLDFLQKPLQRKRNDYLTIINNWKKVFGQRFKVFNYDELSSDSVSFLTNIRDFLNLQSTSSDDLNKASTFFGTDRSQTEKSIFPSFTEKQKSLVARIILDDIINFSKINPEIGLKWLCEIQKESKKFQLEAIPSEDNSTFNRVIRMTESLGDNCELGFWLRSKNIETSSLFRWAMAPIDAVINFIRNPKSIYWLPNLHAHSEDMVYDVESGFYFHTKLVIKDNNNLRLINESESLISIYKEEKNKIEYLSRKFQHNLSLKPGIYVVKSNSKIDNDKVNELLAHLKNKNENHILIYVYQDNHNSLTRCNDNLFEATIESFADYNSANIIDQNGWDYIFNELCKDKKIKLMCEKMFV